MVEKQNGELQIIGPSFYDICEAAWIWYKEQDRDTLCLAENRLMRGEKPSLKFNHNIEKTKNDCNNS